MTLLAAAAAAAGGLTLLFHVWAASRLGADRFAEFAVTWTAVNLVAQTVAAPLELWCARETAAGYQVSGALKAAALTVMSAAAGIAVWLLVGDVSWAAVAAASAAGIGLAWAVKGAHVGSGHTRRAAGVLVVEAVARLSAVPALGVGWAIPAGIVAAAVRSRHQPPNRPRPGGGRFVAAASLSNLAAQTLMSAAPLAVWALGGTSETVGGVFLLFGFARAPVVLVTAAQTVFLAGLARRDRAAASLWAALRSPPAAVLAAWAGAVGAGAVLPPLINAAAAVRVPVWAAAAVGAGMSLCGLVSLVGQQPHADGTPLLVAQAWGWGLTAAALSAAVIGVVSGAGLTVSQAAVPFLAGAATATTVASYRFR